MSHEEHCVGCATPQYKRNKNIHHNECDYRDFNNNGECPCTKCVVKMICLSDCNPFIAFVDSIEPKLKEIRRWNGYG